MRDFEERDLSGARNEDSEPSVSDPRSVNVDEALPLSKIDAHWRRRASLLAQKQPGHLREAAPGGSQPDPGRDDAGRGRDRGTGPREPISARCEARRRARFRDRVGANGFLEFARASSGLRAQSGEVLLDAVVRAMAKDDDRNDRVGLRKTVREPREKRHADVPEMGGRS